MTLVLDLPLDIEAQLAAQATEQGVEPTAYALQILRANLPQVGSAAGSTVAPTVETPEDPTLALLRQWERERDAMTPEEHAQADAEWEQLKEGLNANRRDAGTRRLFP